jgi:hypothetical protein
MHHCGYRHRVSQCLGSGIRCVFDPGIRDGYPLKLGSGIRIWDSDHISESLETIFWVKILKFFDAYPESGMEIIQIRDPRIGVGWKKSDPG